MERQDPVPDVICYDRDASSRKYCIINLQRFAPAKGSRKLLVFELAGDFIKQSVR